MIRTGFAIRTGATGPGLTAGLAALANALSPAELGEALARGLARRGSRAVLEVGSSSRIREAAYFLWDGVPLDDSRVDPLFDAALTEHAFWGPDDFEPYRALAATLPRPWPGARPDLRARWVVIDGVAPADARTRLARHGLADAQLHAFGPRDFSRVALDRSVVTWVDRPATVAAVLGRASAVLAANGPLAFDAARLGRSWIELRGDPREARRRLVATIPPLLLRDVAFLRHVVLAGPEQFADRLAELEYRRDRLEKAITHTAGPNPLQVLGKRIRKLREDPARFFSESRYAPMRSAARVVARARLGRARR